MNAERDVARAIAQARAKALTAKIPHSVVEGEPSELQVHRGWLDEASSLIVSWGCTTKQAEWLETEGIDWFLHYEEVSLGEDVYTWEGLPRWTVWVPFP